MASLDCSPIIRVCRKRTAEPHSALVLNLKRQKTDPLLFSLFKTSNQSEIGVDQSSAQIIDFETTSKDVVVETDTDPNPLSFACNSINEVGGVEAPIRPPPDVITVNGQPMVPVVPNNDMVFDFYKISRGVVTDVSSFSSEYDMRFATKEEEKMLCFDDDSESDCNDDDDDSNDEGNYRNDYPDESDASDVDYDDGDDDDDDIDIQLVRRMQHFGVEDGEYGSEDDDYY